MQTKNQTHQVIANRVGARTIILNKVTQVLRERRDRFLNINPFLFSSFFCFFLLCRSCSISHKRLINGTKRGQQRFSSGRVAPLACRREEAELVVEAKVQRRRVERAVGTNLAENDLALAVERVKRRKFDAPRENLELGNATTSSFVLFCFVFLVSLNSRHLKASHVARQRANGRRFPENEDECEQSTV